ncbi:hypothetical protein [Sinosporangium siamense]|nr:hypothetical protein [Sinosporangium siamense]
MRSAAVKGLDPRSPVIVIADRQVIGVWAGPDLAAAILDGGRRLLSDLLLPGEIAIPEISRICQYTEDDHACGQVTTFHVKPFQMPQCTNSRALADHTFEWSRVVAGA